MEDDGGIGRTAIADFLRTRTCEDLIPESGKVVVFNVEIHVQLAFYALVEHDIKSAPLWDSHLQRFVGMLTVTDLIDILRHYYACGDFDNLSEHTISSWRQFSESMRKRPTQMVSISATESLYKACQILGNNHIHRLPIVDEEEGFVLSIVTHLRILKYLVTQFSERRRLFDHSIVELNIGTYDGIVTVHETTPLIDVLHLFSKHHTSAFPVVNDEDVVTNVYCRTDVTYCAHDKSLKILDQSVASVLADQQNSEFGVGEGLHVCRSTDTLHRVFELFAIAQVHRLIVVSEEGRCEGIISLSDLFGYFFDGVEEEEEKPVEEAPEEMDVAPEAVPEEELQNTTFTVKKATAGGLEAAEEEEEVLDNKK